MPYINADKFKCVSMAKQAQLFILCNCSHWFYFMQPAKLWQSEHWHRKEFRRGKSLGLLCPWPTTAAPMSESLLSRCQSFKATKPFDCALVWTACTIYTWGRVSHWSLVVPCPAYLLESALLIHIHLWAGLQLGLPPVHHQYYTIVLSAMCLKNFESVCNAVLVFDCIAWLGCWGQTWAKRSPSINLCLPHSLWAQVIDSIGRTNGYNQVLIHVF